jgi:hypothetical protein
MRSDGPQSRTEHCGENKTVMLLLGIDPRPSSPLPYRLSFKDRSFFFDILFLYFAICNITFSRMVWWHQDWHWLGPLVIGRSPGGAGGCDLKARTYLLRLQSYFRTENLRGRSICRFVFNLREVDGLVSYVAKWLGWVLSLTLYWGRTTVPQLGGVGLSIGSVPRFRCCM